MSKRTETSFKSEDLRAELPFQPLRVRPVRRGGLLPRRYNGATSQLSLFETEPHTLAFIKALFAYSFAKISSLSGLLLRLLLYLNEVWGRLKFQIIRRLIWGGGRLGRPVAHLGVLALSALIFVVGGLLSSSTLVRGAIVVQSAGAPSLPDVLAANTTAKTERPDNRPRDEVFEYEVQGGETLSTIGEKFRISVETIRYANNLSDNDNLKVGQKLAILPVTGLQHEVKSGDTVENVAGKYKISPQALVDFNYLNEPFVLKVGEKLVVPDGTIPKPVKQTPAYAANQPYTGGVVKGTGQFSWPTDSHLITQYSSYYHTAIDIGGYGPIYAADRGTVVYAGWSPVGYGNLVEVDHGNGFKTGYAHLSRIDVSVGQTVGRGETVGLMGATGRAFGVHLHFMIWQGGKFINPLSVL